jgi:predicted MFS family arabinose efflux permease
MKAFASALAIGHPGRLALLFLAHALGTASITLVVATAPAIEAALDIGHAQFGVLVSCFYGATFVLALPAGWLVDRFGLRAMLMLAHALLATGLWIFAWAHTAFAAGVGLVVCGIGYALVNPATARGVLMWFPRATRATAMSVKQTGVPGGGALAALLVAWGAGDWRVLAAALAIVSLLACLPFSTLPPAAQERSAATASWRDIRALLGVRHLLLFNVATCLYAMAQAAFFAYVVLYARDALTAPIAVTSVCLALAHIASAMGRVGWGVLSDRFIRHGRAAGLIVIGVLAAGGVLLLSSLPATGAVVVLAIAVVLVGATLGGYAGLIQAAAVEAVDAHTAGAAIGYNMLLVSLGTFLGPAAFGAGVQEIGYAATWTVVAAVLALGAALFVAGRPRVAYGH